MKLYKHQQQILKNPKKKLVLAWSTGVGKTIGSLSLADHYNINCLIITPKSIKEKWEEVSNSRHVVVTKEYFRDHIDEMVLIANKNNLRGIIVDEGHYFAGLKSGMTKSLVRYSEIINPDYVWMLTATPYLSTPWNVYTLAVHCGLKPNYIKFRKMFFVKVKMGMRYIWKPKANIDAQLHALLSKFTVWVEFEDVARDNGLDFDMSQQTKKEIFFHQPLDQKKAQFLLTEEGIALWTKKHTVQNGFYDDEYLGCTYYEDPKLDYILKQAKKNPKFSIVCRYHKQMDRYEKALREQNYEVYVIKGGVKDIEGLCNRLDKMDKCIVIIQANISEGYELPSFPYAIFASLSFAYKDYKQMFGRFLRVNAITPTHVDILLMVDGIDIDVYKSVSNKQNFYLKRL